MYHRETEKASKTKRSEKQLAEVKSAKTAEQRTPRAQDSKETAHKRAKAIRTNFIWTLETNWEDNHEKGGFISVIEEISVDSLADHQAHQTHCSGHTIENPGFTILVLKSHQTDGSNNVQRQPQQTSGQEGIWFPELPHYNIKNVQFSRKVDMQKNRNVWPTHRKRNWIESIIHQ